ncbi:MAG: D-alanyl-D-alanine carboxypeptidase [Actinomycetales bacterium]|nr:D-alanyl-D-alanine carboxypeptidase [Actinomycetales bacterium]
MRRRPVSVIPVGLVLGLGLGLVLGLGLGLLAPAAAASAPAAAVSAPVGRPVAASEGDLSERIRRTLPTMTQAPGFGRRLGMVVADADGEILFTSGAQTPLAPASTLKILSAAAALRTLGAETRLRTRVRLLNPPTSATGLPRDGVARIALVGGGDPLLRSSELRDLAGATRTRLNELGFARADLIADDTLFAPPRPAQGWRARDLPWTVSPVRPLVVDRRASTDTTAVTLRVFRDALRDAGMPTTVGPRATAPTSGPAVAATDGHTVTQAVRHMLWTSDNDTAEILTRTTAAMSGRGGDWAGTIDLLEDTLRDLGLTTAGVRIYDGSGLSRANRMPAATLDGVLTASLSPAHPELHPLWQAPLLPKSGRHGTLKTRFRSGPTACARGKVYGKTGTLNGVVTLAGYARGRDGALRSFTVFVNRRDPAVGDAGTRRAIDTAIARVVGCR